MLERSIAGLSQREIAAEEGITQSAVSRIRRRVEGRLFDTLVARVEQQKVQQTLCLDHLYGEAVRAWEASKADTTRRVQKKTQSEDGGGATVAQVVSETQHGDPRYLEVARKALADKRRVWGLDAPQKLDVRATRSPHEDPTEEALRAELARQDYLLTATELTAPTPLTHAKEADDAHE